MGRVSGHLLCTNMPPCWEWAVTGMVPSAPSLAALPWQLSSPRSVPVLLYCGPGLNEVSAFLEYGRSILIPITMLYHTRARRTCLMLPPDWTVRFAVTWILNRHTMSYYVIYWSILRNNWKLLLSLSLHHHASTVTNEVHPTEGTSPTRLLRTCCFEFNWVACNTIYKTTFCHFVLYTFTVCYYITFVTIKESCPLNECYIGV